MQQRQNLAWRVWLVLAILTGAGLYAWRGYRRPQQQATFSVREVAAELRGRARQALLTAAQDYHTALDFSPESVERVEEILGKIHERHLQSPLSNSELVKESLKWGAYIGEVIKTVRPSQWAIDSTGGGAGSFPIVYADKSESFPVGWCHKRITIGEEDNVWHKFLILVVDRDKAGAIEFKPDASEGNLK